MPALGINASGTGCAIAEVNSLPGVALVNASAVAFAPGGDPFILEASIAVTAEFSELSFDGSATFAFAVPSDNPGDSLVLSLTVPSTPSTLSVLSVSIDGESLDLGSFGPGSSPLDLPLALGAGAHEIDVALAGTADAVQISSVAYTATLQITGSLEFLPVPEPTTETLLGLSALAILGVRVRRFRRG